MITPFMPGSDRASLFIESCCTTLEEALSAQARGARRIELCTDLSIGGVTPSHDLIRSVVQTLTIPVNVLIRPRFRVKPGMTGEQDMPDITEKQDVPDITEKQDMPDMTGVSGRKNRHSGLDPESHSMKGFSYESFVYGENDIQQMIKDIDYCKSVGAAGIVVGALTPDGRIDLAAMRRLVAAAQPLPVTFHRAYDVCTEDPFEALEQIIDLGCTRLLTSGQAANAWEGRDLIRQLVDRAADRLIILAGRGVTPKNIESLAAATGAREFHGTALP